MTAGTLRDSGAESVGYRARLEGLSGTLGLNLLGIGVTAGGTLRDPGAESVGYG